MSESSRRPPRPPERPQGSSGGSGDFDNADNAHHSNEQVAKSTGPARAPMRPPRPTIPVAENAPSRPSPLPPRRAPLAPPKRMPKPPPLGGQTSTLGNGRPPGNAITDDATTDEPPRVRQTPQRPSQVPPAAEPGLGTPEETPTQQGAPQETPQGRTAPQLPRNLPFAPGQPGTESTAPQQNPPAGEPVEHRQPRADNEPFADQVDANQPTENWADRWPLENWPLTDWDELQSTTTPADATPAPVPDQANDRSSITEIGSDWDENWDDAWSDGTEAHQGNYQQLEVEPWAESYEDYENNRYDSVFDDHYDTRPQDARGYRDSRDSRGSRQQDHYAHDSYRSDRNDRDYDNHRSEQTTRSEQTSRTRSQRGPRGTEPPRFRRRYDIATYEGTESSAVNSLTRTVGEWTVMLVCVVAFSLFIRHFVLQMFLIPSGSMEETLRAGDKVLVSKLAFKIGDPHRGDVTVFNSPPKELKEDPASKVLIKRIIGTPGDSVSIKEGVVLINDTELTEPYIFPDNITAPLEGGIDFSKPFKLGPHQYFMMGDHRENSQDSRFFGPINDDAFIGRAYFNVWPINRFKKL